jgi:DNA polymerase-3 subunit alpha
MAIYTFECGCKFDIKGDHSKLKEDGLPVIDLNMLNIDYDCSRTWDLICEGKTKGVFQLESQLGRSWAKKLKPRNIEELAALSALLRPGCLKAIVDGKSMTQHYVDRKHGKEKIEYIDDLLEPILKATQGVLVYQEQSMKIAQVIAGFNLREADDLRKAIGKKDASLMAEVKESFLRGVESKNVVSRETAEEIFGWIEKSNRYAFNKSHAVSYAICGYWSAYCKSHFPLDFYCSYLYYSGGKPDPQQEVKDLVSDARSNGISIDPPSIEKLNKSFKIHNRSVNFGLGDIKYIGDNHVEKLVASIKDYKSCGLFEQELNWYNFLVNVSDKISSKVVESLVLTGALTKLLDKKSTRKKCIYEFETWSSLTKKEKEWVTTNCPNEEDLLSALKKLSPTKKYGGGTANKNREAIVKDLIIQLENPPYSLDDYPNEIAMDEERLLGVALSYSKVDSCDTTSANTTCKEFSDGKKGKITLGVEIKDCREWIIAKGKMKGEKMAFLSVEDGTSEADSIVVFPEKWEKFKSLLTRGNTVLLCGETSKNRDGLVVDKVFQI